LTAKGDTTPKPKNPYEKDNAAAEVLRAGAEGRPSTSTATKKASDRLVPAERLRNADQAPP
jgi:hypothetical protein